MKIGGVRFQKLLRFLSRPARSKQVGNHADAKLPSRLIGQLELLAVTELSSHSPQGWAGLAAGVEPVTRTTGSFSGPLLNGVVTRSVVNGTYNACERCIEVVVQAEMLTHDGAKIYKIDQGTWRGAEGAIESLISGESVAVCRFYFIGVPIYNVSDPRYAWLEEGKYLSHGAVEGDKIKISEYRLKDPHDLAELITRVTAIRGGAGAADRF
jgi:hypothetical protein